MLRILKNSLFTVIFLIVGLYTLFPVYSGWLIGLYLPNNISLVSFDSDYPSIDHIAIEHIELQIEGKRISLENLAFQYDLSSVSATKLLVTLQENSSTNNKQALDLTNIPLLSIPYEQLSLFDSPSTLSKLGRVQIDELLIEIDQNFYASSSLNFIHDQRILTLELDGLTISDIRADSDGMNTAEPLGFDILAVIDPKNSEAKVAVSLQGTDLGEIKSIEQGEAVRINLWLDNDRIQKLLLATQSDYSKILDGLPTKASGKLSLEVKQDKITKLTALKLDTTLLFNDELLKKINKIGPAIILNRAEALEHDVPLPVAININLTEKDSGIQAVVNFTSKLSKSFEVELASNKLTVQPLSINFNSLATLTSNLENIETVKFSDTSISIGSSQLTWAKTQTNEGLEDASTIVLENFQLKGHLEPFGATLNEFELVNFIVSNQITATNLNAQLFISSESDAAELADIGNSKENDNVTSPISLTSEVSANIDLRFQEKEWMSDGQIAFSNLVASKAKERIDGQLKVKWQNIQTKRTLDEMDNGNASLEFEASYAEIMDTTLEAINVDLVMEIQKNEIVGRVETSINNTPIVPTSFVYNKTDKDLTANLQKNPIDSELINIFLEPIATTKKIPLKILSGKIQHSAMVNYLEILQMKSNVEINDLTFQFGENEIQGLNLKQNLTSVEPLKLETSITIEKVAFSSGLDLTDVSAEIKTRSVDNIVTDIENVAKINSKMADIAPLNIDLLKVKGSVFEGAFSADRIRFSSANILPSSINLNQISLTELIFFMNVSGLYAEGILDLTLPLSVTDASVVIDNGHFEAIGEGLIKYSTGSDEADPDENIAIQALRNFHYQSFNGNFSYSEKGEYHLKLHLQGSNPDLYDGYPIDFDLNLNGELSGVFRSLFLTGSFEDAVMEQVKADQEKEKTN